MTGLVALVNAAGSELIRWAGWMNLWSAGLLVALVACDLLLARRVAARWRLLLYLGLVARLALPLDFSTRIGLVERGTPTAVTAAITAAPTSSPAPASPAPELVLGSRGTALLLWGAGTALLGALLVRERRRLARARNDAWPAPEPIRRLAPGVDVRVHPTIGPAVVGLLRPAILLPRALTGRLSATSLAHVLSHEAAHVRRHDPALVLATQTLAVALWPIAAVWAMVWRVRRLAEMASDEAAIDGAGGDERRAYGETLLAVASGAGQPGGLLAQPTFVHDVAGRIRALRHRRRWPGWLQGALVVAAAGLALALATPLAVPEVSAAESGGGQWRVVLDAAVYEVDGPSWLAALDPAPQEVDRGPGHRAYRLRRSQLAGLADAWAGQLVSAPRITTFDASPATVRSGDSERWYELTLRPTVVTPDLVRLDADLDLSGDTADLHGVDVPDGSALAIVTAGAVITVASRTEYDPGPISIDLKDADVRDVLRYLSGVSKLNIIIPPRIEGLRVTARLIDVPWRQVLDEVTAPLGLSYEISDHTLRIHPPAAIPVSPDDAAQTTIRTRFEVRKSVEDAHGMVALEGFVEPDGGLRDVTVRESPDPRLTAAAMLALHDMRLPPRLEDGVPVTTPFAVYVYFEP